MKRVLALCALCAALPALSACDAGDFQPFNELGEEVRVLGIRASEPRPLPGQEVTLEALAFAPQGRPVSLSWSWCPLFQETQAGFDCLISQEDFAQATGADVPDFSLGSGAQVTWRQAVSQETLQAFCQGQGAVALPNCEQGIPVLFQVEASDGQTREAAFTILRLRVDEQAQGNHNPDFSGWLRVDQDQQAAPGAALVVEAGASLELEVGVDPEAAELYAPSVLAPGQPAQAREQLTLTWFVEGGSTESTRTAWIEAEGPLEALTRNTWRLPAQPGAASLHLVLRDGRGGVAWRSYPVEIR